MAEEWIALLQMLGNNGSSILFRALISKVRHDKERDSVRAVGIGISQARSTLYLSESRERDLG